MTGSIDWRVGSVILDGKAHWKSSVSSSLKVGDSVAGFDFFYLFPTAILMLAALLIMTSIFLPYWQMRMTAPQYPKGLEVDVYINHLEGDVRGIDALNHYLGMPPLNEGGKLERQISIFAIITLALLLMAAVFIGNRWAGLLALPVLAYPFIFLADLWLILYNYGHSIDPESALGGAIQPFTPPLIGEGKIGQFGTYSSFQLGFYLVIAACVVVLIGSDPDGLCPGSFESLNFTAAEEQIDSTQTFERHMKILFFEQAGIFLKPSWS